jgi:hypothetical protein
MNTIVFAVYNSLKYLVDSVVGIEYIYVLGVEQGNKKISISYIELTRGELIAGFSNSIF